MNLELKINSVTIELGGIVDTDALDRAEFQKAGPLRKLFNNQPLGQTLYQADNCKLECFDDEFCIYPCTHGYLNRDRQWKTRGALFVNDGKVQKLEFQVVDGKYAASSFLDRFMEACSAVLGTPVESSHFLTRWTNGAAVVTSVLHPNKVNADFLIELKES